MKQSIEAVIEDHLKSDEAFQEKINRVLFGDENNMGMVAENKEMYKILTSARNVGGFFGGVGDIGKWVFIIVGIIGLFKGWWIGLLTYLVTK